jgi:hypothetical protein
MSHCAIAVVRLSHTSGLLLSSLTNISCHTPGDVRIAQTIAPSLIMTTTARNESDDSKWESTEKLLLISRHEPVGQALLDEIEKATFYTKLWDYVFGTATDAEGNDKTVAMPVLDEAELDEEVRSWEIDQFLEELKSETGVLDCFVSKKLGELPQARKGKVRKYNSEEKDEEWKEGFAGSCELMYIVPLPGRLARADYDQSTKLCRGKGPRLDKGL